MRGSRWQLAARSRSRYPARGVPPACMPDSANWPSRHPAWPLTRPRRAPTGQRRRLREAPARSTPMRRSERSTTRWRPTQPTLGQPSLQRRSRSPAHPQMIEERLARLPARCRRSAMTGRRPRRNRALRPSHVDRPHLTAPDRRYPLGLVCLEKTAELGAATMVTGGVQRVPLRQGIPSRIHVVVLRTRGRGVFGGESSPRTAIRVGELDQRIAVCGKANRRNQMWWPLGAGWWRRDHNTVASCFAVSSSIRSGVVVGAAAQVIGGDWTRYESDSLRGLRRDGQGEPRQHQHPEQLAHRTWPAHEPHCRASRSKTASPSA